MTLASVTIRDTASGSEAEILPGLGFNCFRFTTLSSGRTVEWLWSDPQFRTGSTRPSRSGIPLLFPHPGRVAGAAFDWEGKHYSLEATDGLGNAIHGFVHTRPWRVVEQFSDRVKGEFQPTIDDPSILDRWPADFRLSAEYMIGATTLTLRLSVENPSRATLPFSLGAHPYFRVPQAGPNADACIVQMPISQRWEVENLLPTGRKRPLDNAAAYASGRPFGELHLDDPFSGLSGRDAKVVASVEDPAGRTRLTLRFDDTFREIVTFTPPHREAICIEPYTAAPDAIHLNQRGVDAGLLVLQPGETFAATIEFEAQYL
jgi:aldose 1-epimerase